MTPRTRLDLIGGFVAIVAADYEELSEFVGSGRVYSLKTAFDSGEGAPITVNMRAVAAAQPLAPLTTKERVAQ